MNYHCQLCKRKVNNITLHHLIPKEEGGKFSEKVYLCQPCHTTVHHTFSNKELAKEFNSVVKLEQSERLMKYLKWIKKQTVEIIKNR